MPPGGLARPLLGHLAALNGLLAAVNLVPAFPLDAGRALRAVLWVVRGDFVWATSVSSRLGGACGLLTIGLGILVILGNGTPVLGLALLLAGFVVRAAAAQTLRQSVTRASLAGVPVRDFMDENPVTVQRALSISALAQDFIYKHQLSMLPVVDGDRLLGYVTARSVKETPRDEWSRQSIGTIVLPFSSDNTVTPETDAVEALDKMARTGTTRLMVVEQGRLAGVVGLQDLAQSLRASALPDSD
jgi:CBS domain-containing protein